jgi:hypothetical protein
VRTAARLGPLSDFCVSRVLATIAPSALVSPPMKHVFRELYAKAERRAALSEITDASHPILFARMISTGNPHIDAASTLRIAKPASSSASRARIGRQSTVTGMRAWNHS